MSRRKLRTIAENPDYAKALIREEPLHSESARMEVLSLLENARAAIAKARETPGTYLSKAMGMLEKSRTRTMGVALLCDAIDSQLDVSEAIPLLDKYLPDMEPIAQDLALAVMIFYHFHNDSEQEILKLLRHENPCFARNTADYLRTLILTSLDVSAFVPELIKMVYHKDPAVSRSAYNAVELAAVFESDERAVLFMKSIYSQGDSEC